MKVRTLWRNFPKPTFNQSLLQEKTTVLEKIDLVSSDRSSYSDVVLLEVQLFQIFTQSIDAIDVTSVTLSHLNSINAIDATRC